MFINGANKLTTIATQIIVVVIIIIPGLNGG